MGSPRPRMMLDRDRLSSVLVIKPPGFKTPVTILIDRENVRFHADD